MYAGTGKTSSFHFKVKTYSPAELISLERRRIALQMKLESFKRRRANSPLRKSVQRTILLCENLPTVSTLILMTNAKVKSARAAQGQSLTADLERGSAGAKSVMDELLPCPFCGSSPEILEVEEGENAGGIATQCTNPQCAASTAMIFPCGDDPEPLLIERWNRRA